MWLITAHLVLRFHIAQQRLHADLIWIGGVESFDIAQRPPARSRASRTSTRLPACARSAAHARPATPAPTTITSYSMATFDVHKESRELYFCGKTSSGE